MSISFCCPKCKASFRVSDEHAGKRAKCKKCGAPLRIPSLAGQAEAPPLPERRTSGADAHDRESASIELPRPTPEPIPPPPASLRSHGSPPPPPPHLSAPIEQPVPAKPPSGSPPSKLLRFEYFLVAIVAVLLVWSLLVNPSRTLERLALKVGFAVIVVAIVWLAHRYHWIETVLKVGAYVWIVLGIVVLVLLAVVIVLTEFAG